jgi:hypothetical protein
VRDKDKNPFVIEIARYDSKRLFARGHFSPKLSVFPLKSRKPSAHEAGMAGGVLLDRHRVGSGKPSP